MKCPKGGQVKKLAPTVQEILLAYLNKHGYDGICTDECGCTKEDLAPCGCGDFDCRPGYNHPEQAKVEGAEHWIAPQKPKGKKT